MPSRTLTPDPPTAPGQRPPPEPPASSGPRLIAVPAGWPPYDCETHGAACPVASEATATNTHVSQAAGLAPAGVAGPTEPPPVPGVARIFDDPASPPRAD